MPNLAGDGKSAWPAPGDPASGQTRWAIVAAGFVVSIVTLPNGSSPTLLTGQVAIPSMTLKLGDPA